MRKIGVVVLVAAILACATPRKSDEHQERVESVQMDLEGLLEGTAQSDVVNIG